MGKGEYQQQTAVPEPLPPEEHEHVDYDGLSVVITAVSSLVIAVSSLIGAIKGRGMWNKRKERIRRETNTDFLKKR